MTRHESRLKSLEAANRRRGEKAQLKRDLKTGVKSFDEILDALPPCCADRPAFELLTWLPQVGHARARQIADDLISETIPVRCLGPQTRRELIERFREATGGGL